MRDSAINSCKEMVSGRRVGDIWAFVKHKSVSSLDLNMPEKAREFKIVFLRFSKDERIILKSRP